ncbi:MAG: threonylcarbamoyl-AMP synthase [Chloroflexi bacterium]|nr:threonylcarbamoyl-AMP synthase [Chloroflexota bacterium]
MTPRLLRVNPIEPDPEKIEQAAAVIRRGGLVAFPTETVYGLGANALDEKAVARIFAAKGRPFEDPLIVHIGDAEELTELVADAPETARILADRFWPGPLTLVLPKSPRVPDRVTAGLPTVAVRMPAHPVALALLRASQRPIAAPSANRFGYTSPVTAEHVLRDLGSEVDLILDGGPTTIGVESTVLDLTRTPPLILRPGGLTPEALREVIGQVGLRDSTESTPGAQVSPGLLASHYAPHAQLVLVMGDPPAVLEKMAQIARARLNRGERVGLLLADEDRPYFQTLDAPMVTLGSVRGLSQVARHLYAGMRDLDRAGVDVILAHSFAEQGLGFAINDRLIKAASQIIA